MVGEQAENGRRKGKKMSEIERLKLMWEVTERRDGATYKTIRLPGEHWLTELEERELGPDIICTPVDDARELELLKDGIGTIRRRKQEGAGE